MDEARESDFRGSEEDESLSPGTVREALTVDVTAKFSKSNTGWVVGVVK